jgi:hypothetical protein
MHIIIKHDIEEDTVDILEIYEGENDKTRAIECVIRDIEAIAGDRDFQIVVTNKRQIDVYEKCLLFGKSRMYRYTIDNYYKKVYNQVIKMIKKDPLPDYAESEIE